MARRFAVGDTVKVGFSVGEIVRFEQRRHGEVALVRPLRLTPGDGYLPHEVPVANLKEAE